MYKTFRGVPRGVLTWDSTRQLHAVLKTKQTCSRLEIKSQEIKYSGRVSQYCINLQLACKYMYVLCMYLCMYVCVCIMYVWMYICMYVCNVCVCMYVITHRYLHGWLVCFPVAV
jgi:hypothetical protein